MQGYLRKSVNETHLWVSFNIWILPFGAHLNCVKWSKCTWSVLLRLQRPDIVQGPKGDSLKIQNCLCSLHQSLEMYGREGGRGASFDIFVWDLISSLYIFYQKPSPHFLNPPPPVPPSPTFLLSHACYPSCTLTLICFTEEYKSFITVVRPRTLPCCTFHRPVSLSSSMGQL